MCSSVFVANLQKVDLGAGEMAQQLRPCTTLAEDPNSVLQACITQLTTDYNSSSRGSIAFDLYGHLHLCAHTAHRHTQLKITKINI